MAGKLTLKGRQIAFKMIIFQLMVSSLAGLLVTIYSYTAGMSVIFGSMVCILPSGLFAFIVFRNAGAQQSKSIVRAFYTGESIKFLLTLGLFLLIFKYINVLPGFIILGYIIALIASWLAIGRLRSALY